MSRSKHSYVAFYMDAWAGGTARMTRLVRSVYFDVCYYNWDKAAAMPEADQMLTFDDLGADGARILNVLVASGKLVRKSDGSIYNEKAVEEGKRAYDLWAAKSGGGRKGSAKTNSKTDADTPAMTVGDEEKRGEEKRLKEESGAKAPSPDEEPEKPPRKTYDTVKIVAAWNTMAAGCGLAQVMKLTEKRRTSIRARLDEYTEAEMLEAIRLIPERPFCLQGRIWCTIDFLARPNTVAKIIEGVAYTGNGSEKGWMSA